LRKLLKVVTMPPKDRELLARMFADALGLKSDDDLIADHL
jgi:hypothetical protein